jgi:hypothetical protein
MPKSIILCTTDGDIAALKRGVPSAALNASLPGYIKAGCYLSDVHDDADCNRQHPGCPAGPAKP